MNNIIQPTDSPFLAVIDHEASDLMSRNHFGQAMRTTSTHNSFRLFLKACNMEQATIDDITPPLISNYQQWLEQRGVSRNSSSCYMRTLQSIYNKTHNGGDPQHPGNPFTGVYKGIARTRKRATTIDTMKRIRSLNIYQGLIDMGKDPNHKTFITLQQKLSFTRDLFIFSYCTRGMAFVDAAYLRWSDLHGNILCYKRHKTHQTIEVVLEPIALDIIGHHATRQDSSIYIFPIIHSANAAKAYHEYRSALRTYNEYLKTLSQMLGNDINLTSYVARHSWASNMHQLNMPLSVISQGLGHDSELTTQIYIKSLETNEIHRANKEFINHVFPPLFLSEERDVYLMTETDSPFIHHDSV